MHTPTAHPQRAATGAATCPWHAAAAAVDGRVLPSMRLRWAPALQPVWLDADAAAPHGRIACGPHEVEFDEPGWQQWGATLARQARFEAAEAGRWPVEGREPAWADVAVRLGDLLDTGLLVDADAAEGVPHAGVRPAPLPPGPAPRGAWWFGDEDLIAQLTGRPLELAWLELVVPVFRVAHLALDADGRQVGEANVFPPAARTEVPTQWRGCLYAGSRHQAERPMNVTALKAMRAHWPAMMALLAAVRAAWLRREPLGADGRLTVGQAERLSVAVLALPTWLLLRPQRPVANGDLHPALSSLFRVTDGLRMVLHQMLFLPHPTPVRDPDETVGAAEVLAYAEAHGSFLSPHGACAGPLAMVEDFLGVVLHGRPAPPLPDDAALRDAIEAIEPAIDYALLGLQAHFAAFRLWPAMARAFERTARAVDAWVAHGADGARPLQAALLRGVRHLAEHSHLGQEAWRRGRERVYDHMNEACTRACRVPGPFAEASQPASPGHLADRAELQRALHAALHRLGPADGHDAAARASVAEEVLAWLHQVHAVLRGAASVQQALARHAGRTPARRPFSADDLALHLALRGLDPDPLPDLLQTLQQHLGLVITIDTDGVRLAPPAAGSPSFDRPLAGRRAGA